MPSTHIRLLQDIARLNALERPDKVALICEKTRLTYAQIDEMSSRLANALCRNGVKDGDRVLFYLMNSAELVVSIFATLKANAIFVGVDAGNTFETVRYILADCEAAALITYDHRADLAARLMEEVPSLHFAVLVGQKTEGLAPNLLSFDTIQAEYPPEPPPNSRIDGDLAFLMYTSGSTGQSKGVMTPHRSALATVHSGIEYFELSEHSVQVSPLQLSFSPGINFFLMLMRVGGTMILEKSLAFPNVMLKRMETERATGFSAVPTMLTLLMQLDLSRYDLSSLRGFTSVGAPLALHLIETIHTKLPNVSIYSFYGLAEAAYSLALDPKQLDQRPTSVGKPFPGTQAWIIDEKGERLGPDQIGELVVRGSHVRCGYWNAPEISAQKYHPGLLPGELVCHTGDLFTMDEAGYFYFVGRTDEVIKSGAKKVIPREIENALYSLDGVLEAAAVPVTDPVMGYAIKAFVVLSEQARAAITAEDVLAHCKRMLEGYKVPREIEIRDSLPKTSGGKIIKTNLT
jgi:acyl-coenzyme A synthetase/AMP-(fatty) acid ligase